jgi:SH3 domain-containing YSC84-like protein 1
MHCLASIRRSIYTPLDLFDQARCVIIIPAVKKGAFIVGGKYGRGFASCRKGERRPFGAPAAVRIEASRAE